MTTRIVPNAPTALTIFPFWEPRFIGRTASMNVRTFQNESVKHKEAGFPFFARYAETIVDNGYSVVAVQPRTKRPRISEFYRPLVDQRPAGRKDQRGQSARLDVSD